MRTAGAPPAFARFSEDRQECSEVYAHVFVPKAESFGDHTAAVSRELPLPMDRSSTMDRR